MLIDTSGWFCVLDKRDFRNRDAVSFYDAADRKITHSYVIAELVALSEARKYNRMATLEFVSDLLADGEIEIIWVDEVLNLQALQLLKSRIDKSWSLCDAVSFILMEANGITEALTTDHHFEQAGYVQLLES